MRFRSATPAISAGCLALILVVGPLVGQARARDAYTVRPGDTLSAIAARTSTSVAVLAKLNHLANPDHIVPGERLVLPDRKAPARHASRRVSHVVRVGEHLTGIAARYGTTIIRIVTANHLPDPNLIFPGQRLTIAGATRGFATRRSSARAPTPSVAPAIRYYRVQPGETLTGIARRLGTTIGRLVAMNGLANPSYLRAGQLLRAPAASTARRTPWSLTGFGPETRALMSRRLAVARLIVAEAKRAGVRPSLALAVAWHESGWQQGVVSDAGAIGVMQLLPDTAEWVADAMLGIPVDVGRTRDNVRAGVALLRHYLDRYHGHLHRVLAAYYQGQRAADQLGIFSVSRPYIASILALDSVFQP